MSFDRITGQERAVASLRCALSARRVAHAYLFTGKPGIGKMTTAVEFAKALVCEQDGDDACEACTACSNDSCPRMAESFPR